MQVFKDSQVPGDMFVVSEKANGIVCGGGQVHDVRPIIVVKTSDRGGGGGTIGQPASPQPPPSINCYSNSSYRIYIAKTPVFIMHDP